MGWIPSMNRELLKSRYVICFMLSNFERVHSLFHQPLHTPNLESVDKFLGSRDAGAFRLLSECYYHKLYDIWPEDIREKFNDGELDNPDSPYYYRSAD